MLRGADTNGDSESIACIAGSISGAWLGVEAIPKEWAARIEKADVLAERLEQKKPEIQSNLGTHNELCGHCPHN